MKIETVKYNGKEIRERVIPKNFFQFLVDCFYQLKADIFKLPTQYTVGKNGVISFNVTPSDQSKIEISWTEEL